jgi:formyl-CoA transferase
MPNPALLDDIVVLDSTQVMAGPYCAMMLADMGARVIKVEPPAGDSTRLMAGARGNDSAAFNAVNRGKSGIVLDLAKPQGVEVFQRLARSADVVLENYRPGVMARLGLDYATLAAENPRLIYASISGYGQTGPNASKGGFDLIAQGESGIMSVTGEPNGNPVKVGVPLTDLAAALYTLSGILAALHGRGNTGRGQHIDTSLVDAGLALSVWEATVYFEGHGVPRPVGTAHRLSAPYQAFACADGHVIIGAANDRIFVKLSNLLGHPEWPLDERFRSNSSRVRHREALAELIEQGTRTETRATWLERFEQAGIPCGPILDYSEALASPQAAARDMVLDIQHPTLGPLRTLGTPIKMSHLPLDPTRRAPMLGEHTDHVLAAAGYSDSEIEQLRMVGAAR